jgi:hypothetical protein
MGQPSDESDLSKLRVRKRDMLNGLVLTRCEMFDGVDLTTLHVTRCEMVDDVIHVHTVAVKKGAIGRLIIRGSSSVEVPAAD